MAVPAGRFEPQPWRPQQHGKLAWPMRHPVWPGSIAIVALLASAVGCVSPSGSKSAGAAAGAQVSASGPLEWLHSRGAAIRVKADGTRTRWEPV